jgi:hypothetical protein
MKKLSFALLSAVAGLILSNSALAQYKAPSQYFRKDFPAPNKQQPGTPPAAPSAPAAPKFKDVQVNTQFYFVTDTNRVYAWTKLSPTTAKNEKNGTMQTINGEIPVQR